MLFRSLCRQNGAGLTCTELVSARGIHYAGVSKSLRYLRICAEEKPVAIQLFGYDPKDFVAALQALFSFEQPLPSLVDINMGCPVAKVTKTGAGSALMNDDVLAVEIMHACREFLSPYNIPLTCKFRRGYAKNENKAADFAVKMVAAGASFVAIHGRTREQQYSGLADRACMREVVEAVRSHCQQNEIAPVPIIANGDIIDGPSAQAVLTETGADGVMIGRAAMGNPWIFREIKAYLSGQEMPEPPGIFERVQAIRAQFNGFCHDYDEVFAARELRKVLSWYLKGLRQAGSLRARAMQVNGRADVEAFLAELSESNRVER